MGFRYALVVTHINVRFGLIGNNTNGANLRTETCRGIRCFVWGHCFQFQDVEPTASIDPVARFEGVYGQR